MIRRWRIDPDVELPDLPIQGTLKQMFRDWAENNISFVHQPDP
jgi:hypothetical protein